MVVAAESGPLQPWRAATPRLVKGGGRVGYSAGFSSTVKWRMMGASQATL